MGARPIHADCDLQSGRPCREPIRDPLTFLMGDAPRFSAIHRTKLRESIRPNLLQYWLLEGFHAFWLSCLPSIGRASSSAGRLDVRPDGHTVCILSFRPAFCPAGLLASENRLRLIGRSDHDAIRPTTSGAPSFLLSFRPACFQVELPRSRRLASEARAARRNGEREASNACWLVCFLAGRPERRTVSRLHIMLAILK